MDILKVKQFEIESNSIDLNHKFYSENKVTYTTNLLNGYKRKFPKLKLIELASLLLPWFESHANDEFGTEDTSISIQGTLKYLEDSNEYRLVKGESDIKMTDEDLHKLCDIIIRDNFVVYDHDGYLELCQNYMNEKIEEIEHSLGIKNLKINPDMDKFMEWFALHFNFIENDREYFRLVGSSWISYFAYKLGGELSDRYNDYDDFLKEFICKSIFNPGNSDGFGTSPHRYVADKLKSELGNDCFEGIPSFGKASNMASELISNLNYILYRYYNDGDLAEDILKDPNCLPMVNVVNYITNLDTENLLIFTRFHNMAIYIIHKLGDEIRNQNFTLDQLIEMSKGTESNYFSMNPLSEELIEKIDKGNYQLDPNEYIPYDELYKCSDFEFMLNEALTILLAIACLLKTYPNWLQGKTVYDLRCDIYRVR